MLIKTFGAIAVFVTALHAQTARLPDSAPAKAGLQSFYVAAFESGEWVIVDVAQASAVDSRVRFIRAFEECGSYHVQEIDYVFENLPVRELVGKADLCVGQDRVADLAAVTHRKRRKGEPSYDGWAQGVVAQCGTRKIVYHLPDQYSMYFDMAQIKAPRIAALWEVSASIRARYQKATGKENFSWSFKIGEDVDPVSRHLEEQAATEIRNGDFDLALPDLPAKAQKDGKTKLSDVLPSPQEATAPYGDVGVLEAADHLGLEKIDPIPYPPMARVAHIQGDVNLEVSIDGQSGAVINSTISKGHPILRPAVTDAAAKWIFQHPYSGPNPLAVKVHFEIHCPVVLQTTSTHSSSKKSRKKVPRK